MNLEGINIGGGTFGGKMLKLVEKMQINQLRIIGLLSALIGFVIVWYFKR